MFGGNNALITYQYNAGSKQLKVTDNGKSYVLLDGVDAFSVTMQPMQQRHRRRREALTTCFNVPPF